MSDEQRRAAVERWRSIWILSVLGLAPSLYLLPRVVCGESWATPAVWCAATASALLVFWRRRSAWAGLKHFQNYPPVWLSGVMALLFIISLLLLGVPLFPNDCSSLQPSERYPLVSVLILGGLATIGWRSAWVGASKTSSATPTPLELGEWLARDEPISSRADDRFGLSAVVDQVREALDLHTGSIALLGAMGSGKSSVREILTREVAGSTRIVRVSLWPFDNTSTAITGLLRELAKELSKEVASAGFSNVANDYLEIIEDAPGPWKKLLQLAQSADPEAELARLDSTAAAVGMQLVLWIEDIERFSESTETDGPDYTRLAPLRALIAQLSERKSIRVVLATSALHARDDLERLVRHVVVIPTIPTETISAIARAFRETVAPGVQSDALTDSDTIVARLCATPRRIKFGLREFRRAWTRVGGEVDLQDTYLLSVLRHACPLLVEAINRNINFLRTGVLARAGDQRAAEVARGRFDGEMALAIAGLDDRGQAAARDVVSRVFPGWERGDGSDRGNAFQSVSKSDGDYWSRLITLSLPAAKDRDQYIQSLVRDSKFDEIADLLALAHSPTVRLMEHIQPSILVTVFEHMLERGGLRAPPGQYAVDALVTVWRILQRAPAARAACLKSLVSWAARTSTLELSAIGTIAYFWLHDERRMFQAPEVVEARNTLRSELVRRFADDPVAIIASLEGLAHPTLRLSLYVFTIERISTADADWARLSAGIVRAAQAAPLTMLPQIAPLFVETRDRMGFDETPTFITDFFVNDAQLSRLFGDSLNEMMIAKTDNPQTEAIRRALEERRLRAQRPAEV